MQIIILLLSIISSLSTPVYAENASVWKRLTPPPTNQYEVIEIGQRTVTRKFFAVSELISLSPDIVAIGYNLKDESKFEKTEIWNSKLGIKLGDLRPGSIPIGYDEKTHAVSIIHYYPSLASRETPSAKYREIQSFWLKLNPNDKRHKVEFRDHLVVRQNQFCRLKNRPHEIIYQDEDHLVWSWNVFTDERQRFVALDRAIEFSSCLWNPSRTELTIYGLDHTTTPHKIYLSRISASGVKSGSIKVKGLSHFVMIDHQNLALLIHREKGRFLQNASIRSERSSERHDALELILLGPLKPIEITNLDISSYGPILYNEAYTGVPPQLCSSYTGRGWSPTGLHLPRPIWNLVKISPSGLHLLAMDEENNPYLAEAASFIHFGGETTTTRAQRLSVLPLIQSHLASYLQAILNYPKIADEMSRHLEKRYSLNLHEKEWVLGRLEQLDSDSYGVRKRAEDQLSRWILQGDNKKKLALIQNSLRSDLTVNQKSTLNFLLEKQPSYDSGDLLILNIVDQKDPNPDTLYRALLKNPALHPVIREEVQARMQSY